MKKIPMRTCVMCKNKVAKNQLLRIVRTPEGVIEFDPTGKKNGRGAYLCRNAECIEKIRNGKQLIRAFETEASMEQLNKIVDEINEYLNK